MAYKFSVVTVTYNSMAHLPALYASLCSQRCQDFEWIVVDGASTDGTQQYLSNVEGLHFRYLSEPDRGIYDAMNKAIRMCSGDYVIFLGADDILADELVLADVGPHANGQIDLLLGDAMDGRGMLFSSLLGVKTYFTNTVHHQSAFYRAGLFQEFSYEIESRVIADYELNLRLKANGNSWKKISRLIATCGADGVSNSSNEYVLYKEMHVLRKRYIPAIFSYIAMLVGMANVARRRAMK